MKKAARGFTIIELLVVISIVAILATVISASFVTSRQKARDARRASDLHEIQNALALYYVDCHRFPTTLTITANNGCPSGISLGSFLGAIPLDPQTHVPYSYVALGSGGNCSSYHVGALFELAYSPALATDIDHAPASVCSGSAPDFNGLSAGSGVPLICDATSGTPAAGGTERCYDVKP